MNKKEFSQVFDSALEEAARYAEQQLGHDIPRTFKIQLHGVGYANLITDPQTCVDLIYINEQIFYRVIDVAVIEVDHDSTTCFVRVSGHQPAPFEQTWNNPPGKGPFKQLLAKRILDHTISK